MSKIGYSANGFAPCSQWFLCEKGRGRLGEELSRTSAAISGDRGRSPRRCPDDVRGKLGEEIIPSEMYIIDRARYRTSLFASAGGGKVPQDY